LPNVSVVIQQPSSSFSSMTHSSDLYYTSVNVLNPHHLSHSIYCSLLVLYEHYIGLYSISVQ